MSPETGIEDNRGDCTLMSGQRLPQEGYALTYEKTASAVGSSSAI